MIQPYAWTQGKRCAAVLSFDFDGESPYLWRSRNQVGKGLSELEQRRFGPRQGIYRILDMLSKWELKGSFYVPGWVAEQYPAAVEAIAAGGHEIGLHGYLHERVDEITLEQIEETMVRSKDIIEKIVGKRNFGYRSPSWEMTEDTFEALKRHDILYDSSLMGYDHPYWVGELPEIPVQWLLDDAIFYRYTGGLGMPAPHDPVQVVSMWKQELVGMKEYGGLFMLTMHPWMSGRASRLLALEELISSFREDPNIWWSTSEEVAVYHRKAHPHGFKEELTTILKGE